MVCKSKIKPLLKKRIRKQSVSADLRSPPQTLYSQNSLILLAPISSQGDLYGLCGAFNGDGTDDFTTSDGTVTTDQTEFTTSYQVGAHL